MLTAKPMLLAALLSVAAGSAFGQDHATTSKQAGVCFRGDDNQTPEEWERMASVFQRHGFKLCAALNFQRASEDPAYLQFVRDLQSRGHEVMDHSPSHRVCLMTLSNPGEAEAFRGKPGVDHIAGATVFFRYHLPDPPRYSARGRAEVERNVLRPLDPGALADTSSGPFVRVSGSDDVYRIAEIANGRAVLQTMWYEETVDLGGPREVTFRQIAKPDVYVAAEALAYQALHVRKICKTHGIAPPSTWIQPGGQELTLWRSHAAAVFGKLGYIAAATYPDRALKCFGEYDPAGDKRFGMQWGDFQEDARDVAWNKHRIAEGVARHYVMIGHSHLSGPEEMGGFDGVLQRTDRLLAWCKETGIPVKTYTEWARILYDVPQDPTTNVFPPLDVDRDDDGRPDGIELSAATRLLPHGGPAGTSPALQATGDGPVFSIRRLAGLEKGPNKFSCTLQGNPGTAVEVQFTFPELRTSSHISFPVRQSGWKKHSHPVTVPKEASVVDVTITSKQPPGQTLQIANPSLTGQP